MRCLIINSKKKKEKNDVALVPGIRDNLENNASKLNWPKLASDRKHTRRHANIKISPRMLTRNPAGIIKALERFRIRAALEGGARARAITVLAINTE